MDSQRAFDLILVSLGGLIIFPVFVILAVLVRIKIGSPILFRQKRLGKDGAIFELVKFRTMSDARDAQGKLLEDHKRLNGFGKFLRSTSLDELPEVWNILRGDMSLVGPRPLLPEYLPLYNSWQARRHEVRPGVTGWAQINGRNMLSWDAKFRKDLWYVENRSLWLDLKILFRTLAVVIRRDGVNAGEDTTMPPFTGN